METIVITFNNGKKKEYVKGIKLKDVIDDVKGDYTFNVICGKYRNEMVNYDSVLNRSGNLELYDINTKQGNRIYEKGLSFLFTVSTMEVLGNDTKVNLRYSLDKGVFCEIDKKVDESIIDKIKSVMKEKVKKGLPFAKIETSRLEAIEYFKKLRREDKVKTLFYSNSDYVMLYKFDGVYNYILGDLPYDSSILKYFDLSLIEGKGVVLRFPSIYDNGKIVKYTHHPNYFNTLEEYSHWGHVLSISNIGELDEAIINSKKTGEIINLSEIVQDYKLLSIAENITLNKDDIKIILISGPSSSGKTTSAKKLALYLKTLGVNPYHLSLDDYFLEREETPLNENGKRDYESLRAIDTKLFNNQMDKLLKYQKVTVPRFDFITGKKVYEKTIQMKDNDVLIIEGLHCLNPALLTDIPKKNKYKIYISPLTFLNIDNDNRISMTDIRLLRRMVRDNRTRGYSPSHTLNNWSEVRIGEEKYIFPFQDEADVIFNSSLAYELAVLKTYAEPLLFSVKEDDNEYQTALRLIELLRMVLPMPSDDVPQISILREFIGGSYFE